MLGDLVAQLKSGAMSKAELLEHMSRSTKLDGNARSSVDDVARRVASPRDSRFPARFDGLTSPVGETLEIERSKSGLDDSSLAVLSDEERDSYDDLDADNVRPLIVVPVSASQKAARLLRLANGSADPAAAALAAAEAATIALQGPSRASPMGPSTAPGLSGQDRRVIIEQILADRQSRGSPKAVEPPTKATGSAAKALPPPLPPPPPPPFGREGLWGAEPPSVEIPPHATWQIHTHEVVPSGDIHRAVPSEDPFTLRARGQTEGTVESAERVDLERDRGEREEEHGGSAEYHGEGLRHEGQGHAPAPRPPKRGSATERLYLEYQAIVRRKAQLVERYNHQEVSRTRRRLHRRRRA